MQQMLIQLYIMTEHMIPAGFQKEEKTKQEMQLKTILQKKEFFQ